MTFRNKHRKSSNSNVQKINKSTAPVNVQCNQFSTTREALKLIWICSSDESYLSEKLTTQSLTITSIWEQVVSKFINPLSNVISHIPQKFYDFTIQYLNNM